MFLTWFKRWFKKVKNEFLSNLGKFKDEVRQCNDIILKADKTRNIYTLKKEDYNQLLSNNITKDYHKSDGNHVKNINKETQQHAINLRLGDRLEKNDREESFYLYKGS